jgi:hypothetical protein
LIDVGPSVAAPYRCLRQATPTGDAGAAPKGAPHAVRLHSSFGYLTPNAFAKNYK